MSDDDFDLHHDSRYFQILQEMAVRLNRAQAENDHFKKMLIEKGCVDSGPKEEPKNRDESDLVKTTKILANDLLDLLNGKDNDVEVVRSLQTMKELLGRNDIIPAIPAEISSSDDTEIMSDYSFSSNHDENSCWCNSPIKSPGAPNVLDKDLSTGNEYSPTENILVETNFADRLLTELGFNKHECDTYIHMNTVGSYCEVSIDKLVTLSGILMDEREDYIDSCLHILEACKEGNDSSMKMLDQDQQE